MESRIHVKGFDMYESPPRCAPLNLIARRPTPFIPRFPSHMFQHVFQGYQGQPLYHTDKFHPVATCFEPAFAMCDEDNLAYQNLVENFNTRNSDITKHVSFISLLNEVFQFHKKPLDATTLADSTSDSDYEKIRKQTHANWLAAYTDRQKNNVQTIEVKLQAMLKVESKKRKARTDDGTKGGSISL